MHEKTIHKLLKPTFFSFHILYFWQLKVKLSLKNIGSFYEF